MSVNLSLVEAALCGGPGSYSVLSTQKDYIVRVVERMATKETGLIATYQRRFMSDVAGVCSITPAPDFGCFENICTIRK